MKTPENIQINALAEYLYQEVRADGEILAQLDCEPDMFLRRVYQYRIMAQTSEGVSLYDPQLPAIGLYVSAAPSEWVRGYRGHKTTLGLQYLYQVPEGDEGVPIEHKAQNINLLLWWRLCKLLDNPTSLLADGKIDRIYPVAMDPIMPLENAIRGFEATVELEHVYPPYEVQPRAALTRIVGDYDHNGTPATDSIVGSQTDV